jgi:hypothetical protein
MKRSQHGNSRWLILVAIVLIVGLFWYLNFGRAPGSFDTFLDEVASSFETGDAVEPGNSGEPGNRVPATATNATPSDRILTCTAPDGSTFYTNAARCEDADLRNRVTEIPSQRPKANPYIGQNCLDPNTPHQFRPVCAEPFRAALELEADLTASADPLNTPELDEYCDLIGQGVHAGCPANSAVFCYLALCQQRASRPLEP